MQGGRLARREAVGQKPRGGLARWVFDDGPALLLTEAGTEQRAGVWVRRRRRRARPAPTARRARPRRRRRSTPPSCRRRSLTAALDAHPRLPARPAHPRRHRPPAGQRDLPPGQALAVRHDRQARPPTRPSGSSRPSASAVAESLDYERTRADMSSSKDRPGARPRPRGRALPGVRRHRPRRRVLRLHGQLLPDLPDRRQGARRQHHEQVPQVTRGSARPPAAAEPCPVDRWWRTTMTRRPGR